MLPSVEVELIQQIVAGLGALWASWLSARVVELLRLLATNTANANNSDSRTTEHLARQDDALGRICRTVNDLDQRADQLSERVANIERQTR